MTFSHMQRRFRSNALLRRLFAIGSGLVLVATGFVVAVESPAMASMSVSGQVMCVDQSTVEGVWIQASTGSGYASTTNINGYTKRFSRSGISGSWTVHVGCGGSTTTWRYKPNGNVTVTSSYASWTCYTTDIPGIKYNFCQHT